MNDVFGYVRRIPLDSRGVWQSVRHAQVEVVCFPIVAAVYAVHLFVSGDDRFHWDSAHYWALGERFKVDGHFSLLAYDDPYRGYSMPLLNHGLEVLSFHSGLGEVTIVKLFGALLAATLGIVVVPRLAARLFSNAAIGIGRVLVLNALFFLYWRDHFNFPLSDFPALLVATVGLLGLLRGSAPGYVVAGLGFGLAANMRPAYLPAALAAVSLAALLPYRPWSWGRRAAAVTLVLAGAFIVSLPQMLINDRHHSSWSPLLAGSREISMLQLTEGLRAQKYETYIGPSTEYPQTQVFYLDPATQRVLEQEEISEITSYGQYARVVARHPVEMAASYTRHVFNGLDVRYPTPYIRDLGESSIILSLLLYTLMFVAIVHLLLPDARRALGRIRWAGIALLLSPCLTAIPGAVEPRFFLPAQLLVLMLVCFSPAVRPLIGETVGRRVALAASYVAFVLVCVTLSSATHAQLEHRADTRVGSVEN